MHQPLLSSIHSTVLICLLLFVPGFGMSTTPWRRPPSFVRLITPLPPRTPRHPFPIVLTSNVPQPLAAIPLVKGELIGTFGQVPRRFWLLGIDALIPLIQEPLLCTMGRSLCSTRYLLIAEPSLVYASVVLTQFVPNALGTPIPTAVQPRHNDLRSSRRLSSPRILPYPHQPSTS